MTRSLSVQFNDFPAAHEILKERGALLSTHARMLAHRVSVRDVFEVSEDALRLPLDGHHHDDTRHIAEQLFRADLKMIILVGIGGSSLGTEALYHALTRHAAGIGRTSPELIILDTIVPADEPALRAHVRKVDPESVVIIIASKSGTTTETIANAARLLASFDAPMERILARTVVATSPGTSLATWAEKNGCHMIPVAHVVGGRWSVLSPSGLFPLLLAGLDVSAVRRGAGETLHMVVDPDPLRNGAMRLGAAIAAAVHARIPMIDFFYFDPAAETLGKWTRQLIAESLGKEFDRVGNAVNIGIMPTVSIGTTDLHSVAQMTLDGSLDKLTVFVDCLPENIGEKISASSSLAALVPGLQGRTPGKILSAIIHGAQFAYKKRHLPAGEIRMPDGLTPESLGAYIILLEAAVIYAGELLNVNVFDQPNVEEYKMETRRILNMK